MKQLINKKGFTLVELLLVITIIGITGGLMSSYWGQSHLQSEFREEVDDIVSELRLQQSNANASHNGNFHGIYLDADSYTSFSASAYSDVDPDNYEHVLPNNITIENINLNGGGQAVVFYGPYGYTDEHGTFDVVSTVTGQSKTITISHYGSVNYN